MADFKTFLHSAQRKLKEVGHNLKLMNSKFSVDYDGNLTTYEVAPDQKEIIIPENVRVIGSSVFYGCDSIKKIIIPEGVEIIGKSAFMGCTNLKQLILPESLKIIGESAFQCCTNLTEMKLPSRLKTISTKAFLGCKELKSIRIPESVSEIGTEAFRFCMKLEEAVILAHCTIPDLCFQGCHKLKTVSIPYITGRIGNSAFSTCGLKRIVIPSTVRTIDANAFSNSAVEKISIPEGVDTLGNGAFSNCNQLKILELTCVIRHMGTNIFASCKNLECITLSEGQKIPDSMFSMCENLKEVHLPSTLKLIERCAFAACENLKEIEFPEGLVGISPLAFQGCKQLNFIKSAGILFSIQEFSHQEESENIGETVSLIHATTSWRFRGFDFEKIAPVWEYMLWKYLKSPEEKLSEYLNQHFEPMLKSLILSENIELIQEYFNQEEFFTEENMQKFILFANEKQAYEIQVMLSEYQRKHFALESIAETIQKKFEL